MDPDPSDGPQGDAEIEHGIAIARGMRAQSLQRLQVGGFGLVMMLLLVGLANIILTNARQNEERVVPEAAATVAAKPTASPASDPLADAGVVPDLPAEPQRTPSRAPQSQPTDDDALAPQP